MKLKSILTVGLLALGTSGFAQTWQQDSIAMGAGYANDVYYKLSNGATQYATGNDWHLSFQMTTFGEPHYNASIGINARTGMQVYVLANTTYNYATIGAADSVGKTAPTLALYNNDSSWGTGAFYQNRVVTDPFSFGWGEYSSTTHFLTGTTVYLLKMVDGTAYKFYVEKYISTPASAIQYKFHLAKLDGSTPDQVIDINRTDANHDFSKRLAAYYNIDSARIVNREPLRANWDFVFTRYTEMIPMGPGPLKPYVVMGVLTNEGVLAVNVKQVNPDQTQYKTFSYKTAANTIGSDWKYFDDPTHTGNGTYKLDSTANYFLRTASTPNQYWQLQFTGFGGGAQGKMSFQKRLLETETGVAATSSVSAWAIAPNPAGNSTNIMVDAKTATPKAQIVLSDMAGRIVYTADLNIQQGMNGFSINTTHFTPGVYVVKIAGENLNLSSRLVVAH
ncbi:MAG: T9SS type A sorting domain-containing protein [Bacteroidetes bacterium]|nr:T9SS type A sorting domain-containing protein [Bacteroidota bacterium]